jgi:hypothetical protein
VTGRVAALGVIAGLALGGCGSSSVDKVQVQRLSTIRQVLQVYQDPNNALARGYVQGPKCVESSDGSGAMGTVFINITDPFKTVNFGQPQELFYDLNPAHAGPRLLGVGYIEKATGQRPPSTLLGHMEGPLPGTVPGEGSHYELHAWLYRHNPDGVLNFWNKNVRCA